MLFALVEFFVVSAVDWGISSKKVRTSLASEQIRYCNIADRVNVARHG